jgi:S-methylmethionine-dependent homocysteine/selenocysteine methylase
MKPADRLDERLATGDIIILDGGMGTELEARGVEMDQEAWSGIANISRPGVVQEIHEDFIRAGADVIITNTYGASRPLFEAAGRGARYEDANRRAVECAHKAREATGRTDVVVAGSIGVLFAASGGMKSHNVLSTEEVRDTYRDQATILADTGVDVIALEMVWVGEIGGLAVEAAVAVGLPVWLGVSVLGTEPGWEDGSLSKPEDCRAFSEPVSSLADKGIAAMCVMHSNIAEVLPAFDVIKPCWGGPLGAYPHYGTFEPPNWKFEDISPAQYLGHARTWAQHGAQLIGGCCGIRPAHIAALRQGLPTKVA